MKKSGTYFAKFCRVNCRSLSASTVRQLKKLSWLKMSLKRRYSEPSKTLKSMARLCLFQQPFHGKILIHPVTQNFIKPLSVLMIIHRYPNGLALKFNINPSLLQTNASLKEMNDWLFGADMSGSINRQEEVSMIPPLLLDVNASHKVLDLCSAPGMMHQVVNWHEILLTNRVGSKTSQILGIMRNDASTVIETTKPATPQEEPIHILKSKYIKGMIVANDSNFKRCSVMSSMHE